MQLAARDIEEAGLAERFRAGDVQAFDAVMTRHRHEVYRVALRMLGRHEDADEAAQRTFVRAWSARRGFRGDAALRTWLIRIALNVAKSMRAAGPVAEGPEALERLPDRSEGAEERVGRRELHRRVRRSVAALPPRQREAVLLRVFSGLTCREAARAMRLSEGAVKAHLHLAVANLRRRFAAEEEAR